MTGTEQANTLDTEMNRTRDEIARRTSAVMPLDKGGTGAKTAATARANLGAAASSEVVRLGAAGNQISLRWQDGRIKIRVDSSEVGDVAVTGDIVGKASAAEVAGLYAGQLSPAIFNRGTAGSWRSLAVQADGTLAHTASARRFKQDIRPLEVTDEQVRALNLVTFTMRATGYEDFGLVAEDLESAGLSDFVFYDDGGELLGVHYERVALAMLPVVQRLIDRVEALEARDDA